MTIGVNRLTNNFTKTFNTKQPTILPPSNLPTIPIDEETDDMYWDKMEDVWMCEFGEEVVKHIDFCIEHDHLDNILGWDCVYICVDDNVNNIVKVSNPNNIINLRYCVLDLIQQNKLHPPDTDHHFFEGFYKNKHFNNLFSIFWGS